MFTPEFEAMLRHRAKTELRKRMRAVRNAIPEDARAARSHAIVKHVLETPEFQQARTVALYWPMLERNEIDLRPLDGAAREAGKIVAYPAIVDDGMVLACAEPAAMVERGHGFAEPPEDAPQAIVDAAMLIVVPALAVDPTGHRIGYGKGYYDWLLARVVPPAFALAVAYDFQVVAEVPTTPNDRAVGLVVTDRRSFRPTS